MKEMGSITFSEIMDFYPAHNYSVYEELKDACQRGCLVPFVGAGLSVFCGYKGWPDVLKQLAKYIYDGTIRADVEKKIDNGELLQAAQDIKDNYPRMLKELKKIIDYDKIKNCDNDRLYTSAAYVLPYLFNNSFVMTTNFDRVLEEVYDRCYVKFGNVITPYDPDLLTQARQGNPHCLFKLHGDIGPEVYDIIRLVFTQAQYDEAYADNSPLMQELSQWFQNKRLLFLGCSLAMDRTMEVLQQVMENNPGLDHYAILACEPKDMSKRCIEMGDLGISAIYYPDGEYEAVRVILERLLEDTNYTSYEELNRHKRKSAPIPKSAHRFMYDSDYTAFVGREKEVEELQEFCKDSMPVSWWAVTGPGGMGKSRLVYEFTNKQKEAGWEVIWLKPHDYRERINLQLSTKRCIVVADDVQAHLQSIGNWIVSVSERLRSEKLRLLLLERDGKDLDSARWAEMMQSDFPYDDTISSKCYCPDFLNLKPLSDENLKTIMMSFAETSGKPMADSGYADSLLQALKKIDKDLHRPIYALAVTDAWCDGKNPARWNKEQVLDALINRELKFYYDRLRNLSTDKISEGMRLELENLLAQSCLDFFLPLNAIVADKYPKLCRRADKLDMTFPELLRQIGVLHKIMLRPISESKKQLESKEIEAVYLDCPDLVKEYLVLRQAFDRGQAELLFSENWDNTPEQLFFLSRSLRDYPEKVEENSRVWKIVFAGEPKSELLAWIYSYLLFGIIAMIPKMEKQALEQLEKMHNQFKNNENIANEYAKGLVNLTVEQNLEERVQSVEKLMNLHEEYPESEDLAVKYAKGLVNLSVRQKLEERVQSVEKLMNLHEEYPESEDLAVKYAKGLVNLSVRQKLEERVQSVEKLKELHGEYPESEELVVEYAKGLVNLSVRQKLEERVQSVEKLKELYGEYPESEELVVEYANGLVNLTAEQSLEERVQSVEKLVDLRVEYPESEELAVEYAKSLVNLTAEQSLEERVQSVEKLVDLHVEYPESEELAVEYARGLVNLTVEQSLEKCIYCVEKLVDLHVEYPESEELAVEYAGGLVNLTVEQKLEERVQSVEKLKDLHVEYPESEELAVEYAGGLVNLTVEQKLEECIYSVEKLKDLYVDYPESEELAVEYAKGLVNLTAEQSLEECVQSVEKLKDLHVDYPESEELAVEYAKGLSNLSVRQKLEECVQSVEKLKDLHVEYPESEDLAVAYANGLVNLSFAQIREDDIQENVKQSNGLFMQYPRNTDIQLSYAKTQFNLTLKQESEALCQTVGQLCEFLSVHTEANREFQIALDTYLGEHPEHTKRYAPLKFSR